MTGPHDKMYKNGLGQKAPSDASEKDEKWFKNWLDHLYALYVNDNGLVGYKGTTRNGRSIKELRDYARGNQDIRKYQELLDPTDSEGYNYTNISWDTVKVLPKFRDILKGKLASVLFEAGTYAIDDEANQHKELIINELYVKSDPRMQALAQRAGVDLGVDPVIESPKDIEVLNQLGGIRLEMEIAMKDAIDAFKDVSGFEEIRQMMEDDLVDLNMFGCWPYIKHDGEIGVKYIDPYNYIARDSSYPDQRDVDMQGYVEQLTIKDLREQGVSEKVLEKAAKQYAGHNGNPSWNRRPSWSDGRRSEYYNEFERWYDDFKVDVLTGFWIVADAEKYVTGFHHRDGNRIF